MQDQNHASENKQYTDSYAGNWLHLRSWKDHTDGKYSTTEAVTRTLSPDEKKHRQFSQEWMNYVNQRLLKEQQK